MDIATVGNDCFKAGMSKYRTSNINWQQSIPANPDQEI
jgi:hypothetical protein